MLNLIQCVLQVILSPDKRILLNTSVDRFRHNETVDIHYLDSGVTNDMNFSFVSRLSIPIPNVPEKLHSGPRLAFSADGSKVAIGMDSGRVSVWDMRSKLPLKTFMEVPKPSYNDRSVPFLQFSSGKLGKEALVFVEVSLMFTS